MRRQQDYYGDVLNTAARIQGKCNEFQKRLLIWESIKIQMDPQSEFEFKLIDNVHPNDGVHLEGKEESINIYDVKPLIMD